MEIDVIGLFPQAVQAFCDIGVIGRAQEQGAVAFRFWDLREFAHDRRRTVDDRPYGGGPGMVLMAAPLQAAIAAARRNRAAVRVAYLSPAGRVLDHAAVMEIADRPGLVLLAGRYEGIDERVMSAAVDEEWSIGDYVLSGGEAAAAVMIDAVVRQLPGVLGHEDSAREDSFVEGLLDCPHYTRPEEWQGQGVPEVLLSGDHARIRRWRLKESLGRTWLRRPDLLARRRLTAEQQALLEEFKQEFRGHDDG
ncbi:MAG TPA: tRNA (guanosine(37)-N1)-methyltransferase TrmD [Acidiferrobacter sp.]|nr:tRNA (guanosine(37)-N1)-methyltransferase TrmD [Acidiferrobacter sp.]